MKLAMLSPEGRIHCELIVVEQTWTSSTGHTMYHLLIFFEGEVTKVIRSRIRFEHEEHIPVIFL